MNVLKVANYSDLSKKAAIFIAAQMIRNPKSVLGFATGSTPEGLYSELVALNNDGTISFEHITTFNLDEYYGLSGDHPQSYHTFMYEKLFSHVDINPGNIHIPRGDTGDPWGECERYESCIETAGGIDLQLLGIGRNGHIGFNEPSECFARKTNLTDLTESTLEANKRFFQTRDEMPKQAISMGINTIMRAKTILLVANGTDKMDALDKMINHPVTPQVPASVLQFHRHATIMYCE